MTVQVPREQTKLWHISTSYGDVELMCATYVTQVFARHSHERFAIGVIEDGALEFRYRGENIVAPSGSVNLSNAGEPHDGHAAAEAGWIYRMFYLDQSLLQYTASSVVGRPRNTPFFQTGVIHDDHLANLVRRLRTTLEAEPNTSALEQESRLLGVLAQLIVRHADDHPAPQTLLYESQAVTRAREYLEAHYAENVSLTELGRVADLSPFHLAHIFRDQVGLPPHT